jgi:hypothetical protein
LTRSELVTAVRAHFGNRTDKDSVIYTAADLAQRNIARCGQLFRSLFESFSVNIAAGDSTISFPTYTRHVVELRLQDAASTTSYPLTIRDKRWIVQRWPNPAIDPQSKPEYGYVENGAFYFVPYSNGDYVISGTVYKDPAPFDDSSQALAVDGSEEAVIAYCTSYVFRSIQQYDAAREWQANYIAALDVLKKEDRRNPGIDFSVDDASNDVMNKATGSYWLNPFFPGFGQGGW